MNATISHAVPPSRSRRWLHRVRFTIRTRLTLFYGGFFLISGIVLLALTYLLVDQTFPVASESKVTGNHVDGNLPGGPSTPLSPSATAALIAQLRSTALEHLLADSAITLAILVAISLVVGWLISGRVLRPLRVITATTRDVSEDSLDKRLNLPGPTDELVELGNTIDGLLARLEAAFEAQRRFVANASHELRTPLTIERTLLEFVLSDPNATLDSYRAVAGDILQTNKQQERTIEALLTLARSQRGLDHKRRVDLAALAQDVISTKRSVAAERDIRISLTTTAAVLDGDASLIERLVSNLVDNALQYNHVGGRINVVVDEIATNARLRISNSGPSVPRDQLPRLLLPFERGAIKTGADEQGVGLGLSIAEAIAESHGTNLELTPGRDGGMNVELSFPPPHSPG
ncbi:MAG TPA: ATP-binding protein [Galbitalea sp.]|jgi:signal transduction histidine kinase|nr:ATP-binding protein [Galbitalea sp.]